jgi:shikimate dehydrogenase
MTNPSAIRLGILGFPIHHTLSPTLHGWLLEQNGLDGTYVPYELSPADLADTFEHLKTFGINGLNVTIPHKVSILPLLDGLSVEARLVQAVNTIVFKQGQAVGYNTDVTGFARSLPEAVRNDLGDREILVLGAGGACRAVLAALVKHGAGNICVVSRSQEKSEQTLDIAEACRTLYQVKTKLETAPWHRMNDLSDFDMVINTTPIGMAPREVESPLSIELVETLPDHAAVLDLIYRPAETRLIQYAKRRGLITQGGMDMLIYQGLDAFQLWTGKTTSPEQVAELRTLLLTQCREQEVPVQ